MASKLMLKKKVAGFVAKVESIRKEISTRKGRKPVTIAEINAWKKHGRA